MKKMLMKCGCAAQGTDRNGDPVCVVHFGLDIGATEKVKTPHLTGRKARCSYGNHGITASDLRLAFFEYKPDQETDRYYCGCWGWD